MRNAGLVRTVGIAALCSMACTPSPPAAPPPLPRKQAPVVATLPAPTADSPALAPSTEPEPARPENPFEKEEPLPEGFVAIAESGDTLCGGLRIQALEEPKEAGKHFVKVLGPDGKKIYEAHGRQGDLVNMDLWGEFCGDLTGDGVPEIVLTERTEGAHCCYTHYAVSMTLPPKRLLMWEKGDAGTPILPARYKAGAAWQIEGSVVMWPPFDVEKGDPVLSYADAPIVTAVFSLVGGEYKLTSLSFPDAYRKHRDKYAAYCASISSPFGAECGELALWIDSLAIGDWDTEKAKIKDDALRATLERRSAAMKKMLRDSLGSEQRPAKP